MNHEIDQQRDMRLAHGPHTEIESSIGGVGERLCRSISEVLAAIPGNPTRAVELSKALGVNQDLAGKTLIAMSKPDPLAAAHLMPGPEALRGLLKAAARKRIDKSLVAKAEDAVREFDDLLRNVLGGRCELDAILSACLPATRERFELGNKQAAFKANSGLRGVVADVGLASMLIHPSEDGLNCDGLSICGRMGLRRLRPGAQIRFSSFHAGERPKDFAWETLDGTAVDVLQANVLLKDFCSQPLPKMEIRAAGAAVHYLVDTNEIGQKSGVNMFLAEVFRRAFCQYREPGGPARRGAGTEIETPMKNMVLDVLLHDSIWPGQSPELIIWDTAIRGLARADDPARDPDRLDLAESIQFLGMGTFKLRIAEIPNYVDLIRYACRKLGWNSEEFRAYRCRIAYPVHASQISMVFQLPQPPDA